jgi:hypothetical protein
MPMVTRSSERQNTANKDMTDRYDKVREDVEFRKDVAKSVGVGFAIPKTLNCSNVPKPTEDVEVVND